MGLLSAILRTRLIGRPAIRLLMRAGIGLCLAALAPIVASQTQAGGPIATDTTWSITKSPYLVTSDIVVHSGATLIIEPGVTVYMGQGTQLSVQSGALIAIGTVQTPITITSQKLQNGGTAAPGDWKQLNFSSGTASTTKLENVKIEYGKGVVVNGAAPTFNSLSIKHHQGAAITVDLAASPTGIGNSAIGNDINAIVVPAGDISTPIAWGLRGIPYLAQSGTVSVGATPMITGISPNSLQQGESQIVSLTGSRLTGLATATFDLPGLTAQPLAGTTENQAQLKVSATSTSSLGQARLSLLADAGEFSISEAITVLPSQPKLASLTPSSLWVGQGDATVRIAGQNFTEQTTAYLNSTPLSTTYVSTTELSVIMPAQAGAGDQTVTLHTPDPAGGPVFVSNGLVLPFVTPTLNLSPKSVSIDKGTSSNLTVSLPYAAPAGGIVIDIASNPSSFVGVPATVTIPQGLTSQSFGIAGYQDGEGTITATSNGFLSTTSSVTVVLPPSLSFSVSTASIVVNRSHELLIQSNRPAGPDGIVVSLASSNQAVAKVPASVTIPAGQQSILVRIDGAATGTATVTASSSGFVAGGVVVTVREQTISVSTSLSNLAPTEAVNFTINLSDPAPAAGLVINLAMSPIGRLKIPATVTVPAGATSVVVAAQAETPGSSTLTLSAAAFRTQTVPITVDAVVMSLTPAGPVNIPLGEKQNYAVKLSRALPFSLTLNPTMTSAAATVSPTSITIAAGQTSSGSQLLEITGQSTGTTALNLGAPLAFNVPVIPVSVGTTMRLQFNYGTTSRLSVPKGFQTIYSSGSSGRIGLVTSDGQPFIATNAVTVNLQSSDSSKATVPASVTIPKGSSGVEFQLTGVELTAEGQLVMIEAAAFGFMAPTAPLAVDVPLPSFIFYGMDSGRLLGDYTSDAFQICVSGAYQNAVSMPLDLVVHSDTSNIIDGFYYFGSRVTQVPIVGQCTYSINAGRPLAAGTYRIGAATYGKESLSNEVVVVREPQLEFTTPEKVVGTGMQGSDQIYVRRVINGQPYAGSSGVSVTLTVTDSATAQVSKQTITIPANASESSYTSNAGLIGLASGETKLMASAPGYTNGTPMTIRVVPPQIKVFVNENDQAVGDVLYASISLDVPGTEPYTQRVATDTALTLGFIDLTVPSPVSGFYSSEDQTPITQLVLPAGSQPSQSFYVDKAIAAGAYRITATLPSVANATSQLIRVWVPELVFESTAPPLKTTKDFSRTIYINLRLNGKQYWRNDMTISLTSSDPAKVAVPSEITGLSVNVAGVTSTNGDPVVVTASAPGFISAQTQVEVLDAPPVMLISGLDMRRSIYSGPNTASIGFYALGTTLMANGEPNDQVLCPVGELNVSLNVSGANPANIVAFSEGGSSQLITINPDVCLHSFDINAPVAIGSYGIAANAQGLSSYTSPLVTVAAPELGLSRGGLHSPLDTLRLLPGFQSSDDGWNYLVTIKGGRDGKKVPTGTAASLSCEPASLCTPSASSVLISSGDFRAGYFNILAGQIGSGVIRLDSPGFGSGSVPVQVFQPDLQVESADPPYAAADRASWTLNAGSEDNWLGLRLTVPGDLNPPRQYAEESLAFSITVGDPSVVQAPTSVTTRFPDFSLTVQALSPGATTLTISAPGYQPFTVPVVVVNSSGVAP